MASMTGCRQNRQQKDLSQIILLDSICQTMSDEYRAKSCIYGGLGSPDGIAGHWFTEYLYLTYDTVETPPVNVSERQLKEGVLLRIAEGRFRIEKKSYGKTYNCPTKMNETEYFFLNNELVKISIAKGYTDYNSTPALYWITIRQLDLLCQKNEIVNRKAYWYSGGREQLDDEWVEQSMRDLDINESALIQKAHTLYKEFKNK